MFWWLWRICLLSNKTCNILSITILTKSGGEKNSPFGSHILMHFSRMWGDIICIWYMYLLFHVKIDHICGTGHREWLGDLPSDIAQLVDFDVPWIFLFSSIKAQSAWQVSQKKKKPHVRERINIYMRNTIAFSPSKGRRSEPRPTQFLNKKYIRSKTLHAHGDHFYHIYLFHFN